MKAKLKTKHRIARCVIAFLAITGLSLLVIAGGQESLLNVVLIGIAGLVCLIPAMMYNIAKEQHLEDKKVTKMANNKKLSA